MSSIEVIWHGDLHTIFFPTPPLWKYAVKASLDKAVTGAELENSEVKLRGLLNETEIAFDEMLHQEKLVSRGADRVFSGDALFYAKEASFNLALLINFILLVTYQWVGEDECKKSQLRDDVIGCPRLIPEGRFGFQSMFNPDSMATFISVLGIAQVAASGFIFIIFLVVKVPPFYRVLAAQKDGEQTAAVRVLLKTPVGYYLAYCIFAFLGAAGYHACFTVHLLDIIMRNETTRDVLNAVVRPVKQLGATAMLGLFTVYIFAMLQFLSFHKDWENFECMNLKQCFLATINWGMRIEEGIGDSLKQWNLLPHFDFWFYRNFAFSMLFFLLVNVILLNVIFGIIIDTFGELREKKMEQADESLNTCFICNLSRNVFDRSMCNFEKHVKHEHSPTDYIKYVVYIKSKAQNEFNGIEDYVYKCITSDPKSISWFPVGNAKSLRVGGNNKSSKKSDDLNNYTENSDDAILLSRIYRDYAIFMKQKCIH